MVYYKEDEVQDGDLRKIDRACEGGASTVRRLAVRVQRSYPAEEYMEKKITTELSFKNVTTKYTF